MQNKIIDSFKLMPIALVTILAINCKENQTKPLADTEAITVDISDLEKMPDITPEDTANFAKISESPLFKREKCKRRFPINTFKFTIEGEGIKIPIKNGAALNIGNVKLGTEIGTAITESVLIIDGYNEQLCQTRNVVGQVALACGQNRQFYKIISLQATANNALMTFFLALKSVTTENEVKHELEILKSKLTEIDKRLAQI